MTLSVCVTDISQWSSTSRLHLNMAKSVLIWLGSCQQVDCLQEVPILSSSVTTADTAWDLSMIMNCHLTMLVQVSSMCRSAYCSPRQLHQVNRSVSVDVAKTVVNRFISRRLDYCNSLLYGIYNILLWCLHAIQNLCIAHLITSLGTVWKAFSKSTKPK